MAASQTTFTSEVATRRDIDESQELQDRGIKREFRMMRVYMDKCFELVANAEDVDDRFSHVDDQFKEQRSYVDDQFKEQRLYVDDQFKEQRSYVDDQFKEQRSYVDNRLQQVEVLIKNSRATSGWQNIYPVRVQDPLAEPPNFPNKVVKFWRLQRPRHQHQLVELLRFYGIRASDLTTAGFEDDDADTESESSSESQSTLEEAVKANPVLALAHLAARLGLDYGSISHNMGLNEQIQQVRTQLKTQRAKRGQSEGEDIARPSKKTVISELIEARGPGIHIEELLTRPDSFSYESPPVQSHVVWANGPRTDPLPSRASASSSKKTATPPPQSSKATPPSQPATIPFTHTPSVVKGAGKTTSAHTSSKHSQTSEQTSF